MYQEIMFFLRKPRQNYEEHISQDTEYVLYKNLSDTAMKRRYICVTRFLVCKNNLRSLNLAKALCCLLALMARKSYRIKLLSTHKNGDFCAIFCNGAKLRCADL